MFISMYDHTRFKVFFGAELDFERFRNDKILVTLDEVKRVEAFMLKIRDSDQQEDSIQEKVDAEVKKSVEQTPRLNEVQAVEEYDSDL